MYFNSRGLFTLHLCYIHLKFGEISHFIKKQKFLFNSKHFFSPPTELIYAMFIRKVFGSDKISYFDRHQKKQWGGVRRGFFMVRIYCYALFCRVKKGGTKYYGLSLFAQKLLRFILFYLKNARANNVRV